MIEIKYTFKNIKLDDTQKDLILEKVMRKFDKYKRDLKLDIKVELEKSKYEIRVHTKFKGATIDAHETEYELYKAVDKVFNKLYAQVQKVESQVVEH